MRRVMLFCAKHGGDRIKRGGKNNVFWQSQEIELTVLSQKRERI